MDMNANKFIEEMKKIHAILLELSYGQLGVCLKSQF